jgi:purine-binding chemotaxis protein CheW
MSGIQEATSSSFDWEDAKRRMKLLSATLDPERQDSVARSRQILDQRAEKLAVPLETEADETASIEILTFRMGGERYALETRYILELTRVAMLTEVPGCPAFVLGITNFRGDVLAIIDLCTLFQVTDVTRDNPWMLVLGEERAEFGIVIDDAFDVCSIDISGIFPLPISVSGVQHNLLRGVTDEAMMVLDGAALLADERLMIDET